MTFPVLERKVAILTGAAMGIREATAKAIWINRRRIRTTIKSAEPLR